METAKLTVRLPKDELELVKHYARDHGVTVTALIGRYFSRLQTVPPTPIHPDVARFTGLVPPYVDARELHREYLEAKHG
ncbi:MAG: DUF6364 family protein [Deferrisomatales bacterium]|nr:DUF6364 family protein [Deferrisomatales bacterium]